MLRIAILIVFFVFSAGRSRAQPNLVPNPSFELYNNCPGTYDTTIPYNINYNNFKYLASWANPLITSPDFHHACTPKVDPIFVGVPDNVAGHQVPRTGNAYVGLVVFHGNVVNAIPRYTSEYIYCKLNAPMQAGLTYDVSFYVSATFLSTSNAPAYAVDRIGVHFSDTIAYGDSISNNLFLPYHVRSTKGVLLADTVNWMEISGSYIAKGGEQYMYIGNFIDAGDMLYIEQIYPKTPVPTHTINSYYYVDDVTVKSRVKCDTVVSVHDSLLCNKASMQLNVLPGANKYIWNNGLGLNSITITKPGTYWCIAEFDTCDFFIDSFRIGGYIDTSKVYIDTTICLTDASAKQLTSRIKNADSYKWNNGNNIATIPVSDSGMYSCTTIKNCTVTEEYFHVVHKPFPYSVSLGNDTMICDGINYTLGSNIADDLIYKWNNGESTCCIDINKSGTYISSVTDGCTIDIDSINVQFFECTDCIWIPNAFTPNNDGLNDRFTVFSKCPLDKFQLIITNRWGATVFSTNSITEKWDGTYKNKEVPVGTYYYLLKYSPILNNEDVLLKGDITLIR